MGINNDATPNPTSVLRRLTNRVVGLFAKAQDSAATQNDSATTESRKPTGRREKRPLQRSIPIAANYPVEALGNVLGAAAVAMHEAIQAPLAICGNSVLAAANLAVQAHADVVVDGRLSPISEFFITVGGTGERKSAADNAALWEHRAYEKQLHEKFSDERVEYGHKSAAFEKAKAVAITKNGSLADRTAAAVLLGAEPAPPLEPILICEEPTFEGLVKNLAKGQPSQGLFSDEGGRFLHGHAMSSEKSVGTLSGLSKFWDAKPIDRIRAGDGAMKLFGRRLSFHIMVQPTVVAELMSDPLAQDQGFLSRCLIAFPESTVGQRPYRELDLTASVPMAEYYRRMRQLLDRAPIVEDASDPILRCQLKPRQLTLTGPAKRIYIQFHDYVEKEMSRAMADLRAFANKAPEHLLRVAGTLSLIDNPDAIEINDVHAKSALALVSYFLHEAHRLNEMSRQDHDLLLAQCLLDWIQQVGRPVSNVEIYQAGPSRLRNAKRARAIAGLLVEHGHIIAQKGIEYRGQVRGEGWVLAD
jgi:Protein of unknown function (DUF3987)